ncbi:MAG: UDP-2,3-diacylglucosamine diphosphatase, partial [bacterium]|nr:UDP-2,3-diacylglucosamine diphosphatase [bacterium]
CHMRYRACWISDLHLGSKKAETELIYSFLKKNEFDDLYLNGDVIDIWRWKQAGLLKAKNTQEHINVVQRILKLAKKKSRVHYTIGNHDEFLMHFLAEQNEAREFGNINLNERVVHTTVDGKKYLVLHGHQFDLVTRTAPWIAKLGDRGYEFTIWINRIVNRIRRRMGLRYWSLSKFIKLKVKKATMIIGRFEESALHYAREHGYDGIICGHIHNPEISMYDDGPAYLNSGCWTDRANCNALVERADGSIDLIQWDGEREIILKSTDPEREGIYFPTLEELNEPALKDRSRRDEFTAI